MGKASVHKTVCHDRSAQHGCAVYRTESILHRIDPVFGKLDLEIKQENIDQQWRQKQKERTCDLTR